MSFEYRPLHGSEIRIFSLLPGLWGEEIRGTLEHIDLSDIPTPQYKALSYVWGDPEITTPISIRYKDQPEDDFHDFQATVNLVYALEHMRMDTEPLIIWIDALCINQRDLKERTSQVSRMRDIYSLCQQVNIWLGRDFEDSDLDTYLDLNKADSFEKHDHAKMIEKGILFVAHEGTTEELELQTAIGLSCIFRRAWFSRVWCLQECVLPKFALCFIGLQTVQFKALVRAISPLTGFCAYNQQDMLFSIYFEVTAAVYFIITVMQCGRSDFKSSSADAQITELFTTAGGWLKSTDERDILYARLGFIGDLDALKDLAPDYGKTLVEVRTDLAHFYIQRENLQFLEMSIQEDDTKIDNTPSWVPSLSRLASDAPRVHVSGSCVRLSPCKQLLDIRCIKYGSSSHAFCLRWKDCEDLSSIIQWLKASHDRLKRFVGDMDHQRVQTAFYDCLCDFLDLKEGASLTLYNNIESAEKYPPDFVKAVLERTHTLRSFGSDKDSVLRFNVISNGNVIYLPLNDQPEIDGTTPITIVQISDIERGLLLTSNNGSYHIVGQCRLPEYYWLDEQSRFEARQRFFSDTSQLEWITIS